MDRKAGHNKLNGVVSGSEATNGNGSRVKNLDCFVQETFEVSKVLRFSSKKLWCARGKVAMAASSCYKERKEKVNAKCFANSDVWVLF